MSTTENTQSYKFEADKKMAISIARRLGSTPADRPVRNEAGLVLAAWHDPHMVYHDNLGMCLHATLTLNHDPHVSVFDVLYVKGTKVVTEAVCTCTTSKDWNPFNISQQAEPTHDRNGLVLQLNDGEDNDPLPGLTMFSKFSDKAAALAIIKSYKNQTPGVSYNDSGCVTRIIRRSICPAILQSDTLVSMQRDTVILLDDKGRELYRYVSQYDIEIATVEVVGDYLCKCIGVISGFPDKSKDVSNAQVPVQHTVNSPREHIRHC